MSKLVFEYVTEAGNRRRVRFVKRDPGGWDRAVEEESGGEWRPVGGEIAADLSVQLDPGALATVVDLREPGTGHTVTGPGAAQTGGGGREVPR